MANQIIFFNTGWMDFYNGMVGDTISGGGKHVEKEGWGGEMFNFAKFNGKFYGYVQPKIDRKHGNPSTVKLEKIGGSGTSDHVSNVTVVWTARHPDTGGTRIIGWFKNATVYRYEKAAPKKSQRIYKGISFGYFAATRIDDAVLLPKDARIVEIRRQQKGWMGQSNVWYADNNPDFIKQVIDYIYKGKRPFEISKKARSSGTPRQPDPLKRIEIEKAAIKLVTKYYQKLGYSVESFEKDNLGWDLEASLGKIRLKLEVKGLSSGILSAELTPNEYNHCKLDRKFYRLCIVNKALDNPDLKIFTYSNEVDAWTSEDGAILKFEERISAKIFVT